MYTFVITFEKFSGPARHNDMIIFGSHNQIIWNCITEPIPSGLQYMTIEEAGQLLGGN